MWNLSGPGIKPVSPALAGGFLSTTLPGKSPPSSYNQRLYKQFFKFLCIIHWVYKMLGPFLLNCYQTEFFPSYAYYICVMYTPDFPITPINLYLTAQHYNLLLSIWNPNCVGQYCTVYVIWWFHTNISHRSLSKFLKKLLYEERPGPLKISYQFEIDLISTWV